LKRSSFAKPQRSELRLRQIVPIYSTGKRLNFTNLLRLGISMYGYNFTAVLMNKGNLFSEKLCALFNRRRGRDIYDTLFMLQRNENVLKANKINLPIKDTILSYLEKIGEKELKKLAL